MKFATCHPDKKHKGRGLCNACHARFLYRTNEKRRNRHLRYGKEWRQNNPERARDAEYRRRYGISLTDYQGMLQDQNSQCAICDAPHHEDQKLNVDHQDLNGKPKVRGLLCLNCNTAIGSLKHNPILLRKAVEYPECR